MGRAKLEALLRAAGPKAALVGAVLAQLGHEVNHEAVTKALDTVSPHLLEAMGLHPKKDALQITPLPASESRR